MNRTEQIIHHLQLAPHPEGGYFRESYRSKETVAWKGSRQTATVSRNYSTSIYFLLTDDDFSAFHRIPQDEIWHFYEGAAVRIHMISPQGEYSAIELGNDFGKGEMFQFTVPGNTWFAAAITEMNSFSLVGCTVSPGFDFCDFELAIRHNLVVEYPHLKDIITLFTRV